MGINNLIFKVVFAGNICLKILFCLEGSIYVAKIGALAPNEG